MLRVRTHPPWMKQLEKVIIDRTARDRELDFIAGTTDGIATG
jgi:hypothetical protein